RIYESMDLETVRLKGVTKHFLSFLRDVPLYARASRFTLNLVIYLCPSPRLRRVCPSSVDLGR
ncbi:MAG: hypothetical protein KAV87_29655, partial [Desulfobacteraceae bacterium]|nr:hypothetical protein [Desulfobacteraceae bacterium]